jgi:UDP:flavonoid glycosyltransferase YjiC (YdhE family)
MSLGEAMPARGLEAEALAAMLRRLAGDDALAMRSRQAAPAFRARAARSSEEEAMDAIEALLRR